MSMQTINQCLAVMFKYKAGNVCKKNERKRFLLVMKKKFVTNSHENLNLMIFNVNPNQQ